MERQQDLSKNPSIQKCSKSFKVILIVEAILVVGKRHKKATMLPIIWSEKILKYKLYKNGIYHEQNELYIMTFEIENPFIIYISII